MSSEIIITIFTIITTIIVAIERVMMMMIMLNYVSSLTQFVHISPRVVIVLSQKSQLMMSIYRLNIPNGFVMEQNIKVCELILRLQTRSICNTSRSEIKILQFQRFDGARSHVHEGYIYLFTPTATITLLLKPAISCKIATTSTTVRQFIRAPICP